MSWILLGNSVIKRGSYIKSVPVPVSAEVTQADPNEVVITFDQALNETSIPATSDFALAGKTISNVTINGTNVTLTVTVQYQINDIISVSYTKPALNLIKALVGGGKVESFTQSVTNNVLYPIQLDTVGYSEHIHNVGVGYDGSPNIRYWYEKNNLSPSTALRLERSSVNSMPISVSSESIYFYSDNALAHISVLRNTNEWGLNGVPYYFAITFKVISFIDNDAIAYNLIFNGDVTTLVNCITISRSDPNTLVLTDYPGGGYSSVPLVLDKWYILRLYVNGVNSKVQWDNNAIETKSFLVARIKYPCVGANYDNGFPSDSKVKHILTATGDWDLAFWDAIYWYMKGLHGI